jgi:mono/diheme cytochrome c family protein
MARAQKSRLMTMNPRSIVRLTAAAAVLAGALAHVETPRQGSLLAAGQQTAAPDAKAVLDRYCVTCHNARARTGGLALDEFDIAQPGRDPETWEAVVRKLRTGMMPPSGASRPDRPTLDRLALSVENALDRAAAASPNPGATALHRLNRAEYANAVRDLLDLPIDATTLLPGDDSSEGFDNIANVLVVSPALMQAYVTAAAKISRLAVGDPTISSGLTTYSAPRGLSQTEHREGMPLGTRGGLEVVHVFPLDAEYEFRIGRAGAGFGLAAVGGDEAVELTLNGERVQLVGGRGGGGRGGGRGGGGGGGGVIRLRIPAGPQTIGAAIVRTANARGVDDLYSELSNSAGVSSLSITGPLNPTGPGDTPSRRRIFTCTPASGDGRTCARQILAGLATRAFRRPVGGDAPAIDILMDFYESGRELRGFDAGIQYALARILVDPQFIYRFERAPAGLAAGAVYRISDPELASRLSFFLWSSIPDDELLAAAAAGRLADPAVLDQQTRRMLADPRARSLVDNVAGQWLLLRQLDDVAPASREFDGNLRYSFRRETELLFETILREDRSIVDLIDASYTFVDERLARHYGIPNVRGSRFRRVTLQDGARRGLLGHGSLLTVTSVGNRTSPVKRGKWILENLLGAPVPLPPPGVETNLEESTAAGAGPTSLRQRLEQHRANPSCASCHAVMDPIGFSLENFDLIGQWRETDGGVPVNASGRLADGTQLNGPEDLRKALLDRREAFVSTASEKLLTSALGRQVEVFDMPAIRALVRGAAPDDYRFSALVLGIVTSTPFQMKRYEGETEP